MISGRGYRSVRPPADNIFSPIKRRGRDRRPSAEEPAAAIAGSSVISNPIHVSLLPSSWRTLYELTRLPDEVLEARIVISNSAHARHLWVSGREVVTLTSSTSDNQHPAYHRVSANLRRR